MSIPQPSGPDRPSGTGPVPGVVHHRSPHDTTATLERLRQAIAGAGATVFCELDQSAEAERAGLELRPTNLLVFGNPAAGTAVMVERPVAALDLPLKLLVWQDDGGATWITHLDAGWLGDRYAIPDDRRAPLGAPAALAAAVVGSGAGGTG